MNTRPIGETTGEAKQQTIEARLAPVLEAARGRAITGLSLAARVELSAHSLNNEGSRNNATIPRQMHVLAGDEILETNAISGDTVKHGFVDYLRQVVLDHQSTDEEREALTLCEPCRVANANRLNADPDFQKLANDKEHYNNAAVLDSLIKRCVVDDVAGLLVTMGNRNAPRQTKAKFSWMLGIPHHVETGRYTHVKLVPGAPEGSGEAGTNLGQNIFVRPASSGAYALVALLELSRIGVNDITHQPAISMRARQIRAHAVIEALYYTLALPTGAQRNTQLPHIQQVSGAICLSYATIPPAMFSPLEPDFVDQMERITRAFGRGGTDLHVVPFARTDELGSILTILADRPLGIV